MKKDVEFGLDNKYNIGAVRQVIHVDQNKKFYMLANNCFRQIGLYLIEVDEEDPESNKPALMINFKNKLDIDDANIYLIENKLNQLKQLIISYKTIYINTFNVTVFCLNKKSVIFRYEISHLWEANIRGVLLNNYDYIIIRKDGKSVMNLDLKDTKKPIKGINGKEYMLYSLSSFNYLKLEDSNLLMFQ